jgi:hypothetical protein
MFTDSVPLAACSLCVLQDLAKLKYRMINWLFFWRAVNWRQNKKPFLLLASAETTLGVSTILTMVKNRIWHWQRSAAQQLQTKTADVSDEQQRLQRALAQWQHLQRQHTTPAGRLIQRLQQVALQRQQQGSAGRLVSGLTTLYQLGVETNQQMMQEVLGNFEVGTSTACVITPRLVLLHMGMCETVPHECEWPPADSPVMAAAAAAPAGSQGVQCVVP